MAEDRHFRIGETVHLYVGVSEPGSRTPRDATVTLHSLKRGGAVQSVEAPQFVRRAEGDYELVLPTEGRAPGVYEVVVRVADDDPVRVSLVTDKFVLQAL